MGRTTSRSHLLIALALTVLPAPSRAQRLTLAVGVDAVPESHFLRVHRCTIVSLTFVQRITPWSNYAYLLHIACANEPVVMSRRYAARVRGRLGA